MSTPIGHTLVGLALARRLGVRSPRALAASIVAASLPDADVILSLILYRDAWKLHRKATHTAAFALTAGAIVGGAGVITAAGENGTRDPVADALIGATIAGSHILLDNLWFPYIPRAKGAAVNRTGVSAVNWMLDALVYAIVARLIWPHATAARQQSPQVREVVQDVPENPLT